MIFVLSGEGPTDLGKNILGKDGIEFVPGPVTYFVDGLYREKYQYSLLESNPEQFCLISESDLSRFAKSEKGQNRRNILIPGIKNHHLKPHGFMARALGWKAEKIKEDTGEECVIPVFFRDTDSNDEKDYQEKLISIDTGFAAAGFPNRGVAILAKPKSEAWLLCLADHYQNGHLYENGPANDASPNSLKSQLAKKINPDGENPLLSAEQLCSYVKGIEQIDFDRMCEQLSSFAQFVHRFQKAINAEQD
ncbi:hypothetical protein ACFPVS_09730 [Neisseria weixii]|uniref:hypothetical protein n=1 Tax=Neisseria weixii TaxID=1853276 RepID=UPI000BB9ADDD|nr:hypothetical protein [Neisseria weixii]ATD64925.1 hypothetical protein CGZ65_05595 [Neisseria weixii]